jgi:hypothetical protein
MSLFQHGEFTLHSGSISDYKIECEALTPSDWDALARIIKVRIPAFGAVYGVPRGGVPLQEALTPFATGNELDPVLIVDDVYTTGASMREAAKQSRWNGPVLGVVVFAREPVIEPWVQAVFGMLLETNSRASLYVEVLRLRMVEEQLLTKIRMFPARVAEELASVQPMGDWSNEEVERPEAQLNSSIHHQKFEKCKQALSSLYYDSSYTSRSKHVNEFLDDAEIQGWIREKA